LVLTWKMDFKMIGFNRFVGIKTLNDGLRKKRTTEEKPKSQIKNII
jgi:hypothetical protein